MLIFILQCAYTFQYALKQTLHCVPTWVSNTAAVPVAPVAATIAVIVPGVKIPPLATAIPEIKPAAALVTKATP